MKEPKYNEKYISNCLELYISGKTPMHIWVAMGKIGKKKSWTAMLHGWIRKVNLPRQSFVRKVDWNKIKSEVNPEQEDY